MKFSFKDKVMLTKGFYKGFTGEVRGFKEDKRNSEVRYNVIINSDDVKDKDLFFNEEELRPLNALEKLFNK